LAKAGNAIPKETFTERERISGKVGLPMVRVDTGDRVRTSEKTGPPMDVAAFKVLARILGGVGSVTHRETFTEPVRTLAVASNKILKATCAEPERTLGKDGSMTRIKG
jgi:hypothetical protein